MERKRWAVNGRIHDQKEREGERGRSQAERYRKRGRKSGRESLKRKDTGRKGIAKGEGGIGKEML